MKEAQFSTEVVRSVRYAIAWAYKIPDAPITKEILKITRFTNAKPCDIVVCYQGRFVAIETKQFKKWGALGRRHFRPEQLTGLTDIVANGGRAFVFLNIRIKKPYENRLIIFDWETWGPSIIAGKSIFAKDLQDRAYYDHFVHDEKILFDLSEWTMLL